MDEIELKFQVPPAQAAAVARAVATATARTLRLQAAYADTADRRLAAAGLALRLRREGPAAGAGGRRTWVQTLKGRGDGLMARPEHEVAVSTAAAQPDFDVARHAGTPVGERLRALLADGAPLQVLYRTDVRRTLRTLRSGGATLELAHDRGHVEAGGRRVAVDELEFELKAGPAAALVALAARWVARHGLWWDVRTKSERGFRLAEGLAQVPAVRAAASSLVTGRSAPQVLAALVTDALAQVLPNAAEIATGQGAPEHLHQLRVGLRRLRSVLREAAALAGDEAEAVRELERAWAEPFRRLGAARDADALAAGLWPGVDAALAAAGLAPLERPAVAPDAADDPAALLRGAEVQRLLLQSLALAWATPTTPAPAATAMPADEAPTPSFGRDEAAALLQPLWKRVRRGARDLAAADPERLHGLRKRAKRLRYLLEALAPLLRRKALQRLLAALKPALDRLGEINDLHTAELALRALPPTSASQGFALGLVVERRRALLPVAQQALDRTFALAPPWR
jgi:inorganic triphosphatase YgiF